MIAAGGSRVAAGVTAKHAHASRAYRFKDVPVSRI
jgi:hypothetical protein